MNSHNKNNTKKENNNNTNNLNNIKSSSSISQEIYNFNELLENEKEYIVLSKLKKDPEANTCTYKKGYIQQEVIFCQTCYIEKKLSSGICIGCAYTCHAEHEVLNLGFKRNFKCDCGNSKFCNK